MSEATVFDEQTLLERIQAPEGQGLEIKDAATGELIGRAPQHTVDDLEDAIARAKAAQPGWEGLGHDERIKLMHAAADAVEANAEPLARLLSREQGKPLNGPNARFEVGAVSLWLRNFADTELPDTEILNDESGVAHLHYRAAGVTAAIGPWNWPMMIGIWQIGPSLRMGNTVIVKPSSNTPLSVLAMVYVMNTVLPADVLIPINGQRGVSGRLAAHPDIAKVMFTGSTETGRKIVEGSAGNLARLTLELGGNDAGIVLPGTDPKAIAEDLFWGAFINTGQTCAAMKRLYVHESIYDEVVEELKKVVESMPMGNGLDENNVLGPLQNKEQFDIVKGMVDDAVANGGRIVTGGEAAPELGANFYKPTLVADVSDGVKLVDEEQFGPALPIIKYSDVDDAIRRANAVDVGLGGSVWAGDREEALKVASRIESGTVWINSHGGLNPNVPFGGVKSSGYGLEFGVEGLKAVSVPQVIQG